MQQTAIATAAFIMGASLFMGSTWSLAETNCMRQLADAARAKKVSFELFEKEGEVWVEARTDAPLRPLAAGMTKCLDAAYPERKTVTIGPQSLQAVLWQKQTDNLFDWCAASPKDVQKVGGNGPKRDWYIALYSCRRGQRALPTCVPGIAC